MIKLSWCLSLTLCSAGQGYFHKSTDTTPLSISYHKARDICNSLTSHDGILRLLVFQAVGSGHCPFICDQSRATNVFSPLSSTRVARARNEAPLCVHQWYGPQLDLDHMLLKTWEKICNYKSLKCDFVFLELFYSRNLTMTMILYKNQY